MGIDSRKEIPILKINQWLDEWDKIQFNEESFKAKPEPFFYVFSMSAKELKSLTGIQRRKREDSSRDIVDTGIQRRHEIRRSEEIHEFIKYGYPWSELTEKKRVSGEFNSLRKPGWLPTAIVVNILKKDNKRRGDKIDEQDVIVIDESESRLLYPASYSSKENWRPKNLYPIEVIDGQHRLWAFEEEIDKNQKYSYENYQLPVVAFHGLDISWQAYLFWVINIKPKKINPSLAFDLYPLLRSEDWFDKIEGHSVYREIRAQELVEILWFSKESPWHNKINMLGEPGNPYVTQAAWIRALTASFIKPFEGQNVKIGGIYGGSIGQNKEVLSWNRMQQAAFIILAGNILKQDLHNCNEEWVKILNKDTDLFVNPEFYGKHTLLNTDQGIRGFLHIINDLSYIKLDELNLKSWYFDIYDQPENNYISDIIKSLENNEKVVKFFQEISSCLTKFDWRTASEPNLTDIEKRNKLVFRGSGGYKLIRIELLQFLTEKSIFLREPAKEVLKILSTK